MSRIVRKIRAILGHKCPKCHKGDLFYTRSFSFKKPFDMCPGCKDCGQSFFPEPGFYYGSMFTSYIITSFFSLGLVGFCIIVMGWTVEASFGLLIAILAVFFVWFFRTSRSAWIHLTVRYDPDAISRFRESGGEVNFPDFVNKNF